MPGARRGWDWNSEALLQRVVVQAERDLEAEGKGVDGSRLGILVQHQPTARRRAVEPCEPSVASKPVLRQPVRLAPMAQRVVLQAADDGEENGRVTWPDRRRLPEHLLAGSIAQRAQFRSIRLHSGGKRTIRQHMSIHHSNATQRFQAPLELDAPAPACCRVFMRLRHRTIGLTGTESTPLPFVNFWDAA